MKVVVISEQTRQRMLSEDPLLGDLDNQLKDIEKKKKEDDSKKKNNNKDNNVIIKKDNNKLDTNKVDTNKVDTNKVDTNKVDTNKVDTNKVDTNKVDTNKVDTNKVDTNKVDTNKVDTSKPDYKIDKSTPTMDDFKSEVKPVKPTNPSGKVIPKPTKPLMKNSPAAKAGISKEIRQKFANQNAAFQATKNKDSGYTKMDFIKDFPQSQTAKKFNKGERIPGFSYKKNLKNSYEPYHIVLGYVLSEGHAETVEEAHYVMTQMDSETIQEIVALDEGLGGKIASVAALTLGGMGLNAIRQQMQNKEKMEKGGEFRKGSTMDNIQKKKDLYKQMGITK